MLGDWARQMGGMENEREKTTDSEREKEGDVEEVVFPTLHLI